MGSCSANDADHHHGSDLCSLVGAGDCEHRCDYLYDRIFSGGGQYHDGPHIDGQESVGSFCSVSGNPAAGAAVFAHPLRHAVFPDRGENRRDACSTGGDHR